jgi:hypothetical protein
VEHAQSPVAVGLVGASPLLLGDPLDLSLAPNHKTLVSGSSGCGVPRCNNCDAFVTEQYVRVFAPDEMETVRVCPHCEDKLRDGNDVREARAPRQQ